MWPTNKWFYIVGAVGVPLAVYLSYRVIKNTQDQASAAANTLVGEHASNAPATAKNLGKAAAGFITGTVTGLWDGIFGQDNATVDLAGG